MNTQVIEIAPTKQTNDRVYPEIFKSQICHKVKEMGALNFIIDTLKNNTILNFWGSEYYFEAFYTLAMVDYLSRLNDIPLCTNYNKIRAASLKETLYPRDIILLSLLYHDSNILEQSYNESIPEFRNFNIVENEVMNVV